MRHCRPSTFNLSFPWACLVYHSTASCTSDKSMLMISSLVMFVSSDGPRRKYRLYEMPLFLGRDLCLEKEIVFGAFSGTWYLPSCVPLESSKMALKIHNLLYVVLGVNSTKHFKNVFFRWKCSPHCFLRRTEISCPGRRFPCFYEIFLYCCPGSTGTMI